MIIVNAFGAGLLIDIKNMKRVVVILSPTQVHPTLKRDVNVVAFHDKMFLYFYFFQQAYKNIIDMPLSAFGQKKITDIDF